MAPTRASSGSEEQAAGGRGRGSLARLRPHLASTGKSVAFASKRVRDRYPRLKVVSTSRSRTHVDAVAHIAYNAIAKRDRRLHPAVLNIRNLPDQVHAALRIRAAKAGRSMEAEAREILTRACQADDELHEAASITRSLPDWVDELFGPDKPTNVVDALIAERRLEAARE